MINFKQKDDAPYSALILISIAIMVIGFVYLILPPPNPAAIAKGQILAEKQISRDIANSKKMAALDAGSIRQEIWTGKQEFVTAAILDKLTSLANARSLKMAAFRPERNYALGGVIEAQYSVQITGDYSKVYEVIHTLDNPKGKIILRATQINAAGGSATGITATLSLSAYLSSNLLEQKLKVYHA